MFIQLSPPGTKSTRSRAPFRETSTLIAPLLRVEHYRLPFLGLIWAINSSSGQDKRVTIFHQHSYELIQVAMSSTFLIERVCTKKWAHLRPSLANTSVTKKHKVQNRPTVYAVLEGKSYSLLRQYPTKTQILPVEARIDSAVEAK